ncbi:hypothetical protein [Streptococcus sp. HF-100]|uniref:hypothetical protein n=1 Tax=Streptococcus sp. HF-100 TaxID=2785791 RepID=UPI0018A0EF72|nr:hypothetical protein [Streptococcus sp. HF-100]MBF7076256.1 hypothetical protein [Streptococcus sp. HF-100]
MKKTYYQKIFNTCTLLFVIGFLGTVCSILLSVSINSLKDITYLTFLYQFVIMIYTISLYVSIVATSLCLALAYYEIYLRLKQDNLVNLWKSIKQTVAVRMFLNQNEHSETVTTVEQIQVTRYNPINKHFNKAVHKAIVDIREDKAVLLIRVPKTQQATKILKEMETHISEDISNRNLDYYFSRPERNGKWMYFIGTKRK